MNTNDVTMDTKITQKKIDSLRFKITSQEYLHWPNKLGHLSHKRMQQLTKIGILQKYLNLKHAPMCIACINGKATKKPWRSKKE
jgi:hypothetical protein